MSLVLTWQGEAIMARQAISYAQANMTFKFCLFVNDYTPVRSMTISNLAEQVPSGGYARVSLTSANWNNAYTASSGAYASSNTYVDFVWTSVPSGYETVYGYYVLDENNVLLGAERFATPFVINLPGAMIRLLPQFIITDESDHTTLRYKIPDAAEVKLLNGITGRATPATNLYFYFYTNDVTPTETSVLADFTRLFSDSGLSKMWGSAPGEVGTTDAGVGKYNGAPYTGWTGWTLTQSSFTGTVYGYVIDDGSTLLTAYRFPEPLVIGAGSSFSAGAGYSLRDLNFNP